MRSGCPEQLCVQCCLEQVVVEPSAARKHGRPNVRPKNACIAHLRATHLSRIASNLQAWGTCLGLPCCRHPAQPVQPRVARRVRRGPLRTSCQPQQAETKLVGSKHPSPKTAWVQYQEAQSACLLYPRLGSTRLDDYPILYYTILYAICSEAYALCSMIYVILTKAKLYYIAVR